jgi:hypothetical protein
LLPGLEYGASIAVVLVIVCLVLVVLALVGFVAFRQFNRWRESRPQESVRAAQEKEKDRQRKQLKRGVRGDGGTVSQFGNNEIQLENIPKYDEAAFGGGTVAGGGTLAHQPISGGTVAYDESSFGTAAAGGSVAYGGGSIGGGNYAASMPTGAFVCVQCGNAYPTQHDLQLHCQKRGHNYGQAYPDANFRDALSQPFGEPELPVQAAQLDLMYNYDDGDDGNGEAMRSLF